MTRCLWTQAREPTHERHHLDPRRRRNVHTAVRRRSGRRAQGRQHACLGRHLVLRIGYVIVLLGSFFAAIMSVVHMCGAGVGGEIAESSGGFFFIWTLIALGVTGTFSLILSARGLWRLRRGQPAA